MGCASVAWQGCAGVRVGKGRILNCILGAVNWDNKQDLKV